MTSARDPVGISSQDSRIELTEDASVSDLTAKANEALRLIRDDIQRLAGLVTKNFTTVLSSGGWRLPMTATGIASLWAISDTPTTGSTGISYHVLTMTRNGIVVGNITYDTRRAEIPAYRGGCYLGQVAVSNGDVLAVSIAVTGGPAPTLTTANFCLLSTVRGS